MIRGTDRVMRRALAALLVLLAACTSGFPKPPAVCPGCTPRQPNTLDETIRRLAGQTAKDCGTVVESAGSEERLGEQQRCIEQALTTRRPFFAKRRPMAVDSLVVYAIAANDAGEVSYVFYDSSPCGVSDCGERVVVKPCRSPRISEASGGGYVCE